MTETAPRPGMAARRTIDGELIEWLDVPKRAIALGMEPHPEGGWYVRTWTSPASVRPLLPSESWCVIAPLRT